MNSSDLSVQLVTSSVGDSAGADGVVVLQQPASSPAVTSNITSFDGTYSVNSLSPGNYVVCFDGRNTFSGTGFLPQCYNGVAWSG